MGLLLKGSRPNEGGVEFELRPFRHDMSSEKSHSLGLDRSKSAFSLVAFVTSFEEGIYITGDIIRQQSILNSILNDRRAGPITAESRDLSDDDHLRNFAGSGGDISP